VKNYITYFFSILLLLFPSISEGKSLLLSPLDYGLREAKNGIERYEALCRCHEDAFKSGADVSYNGIDSLFIEIPNNPKSIRLTDKTDFAGVVLTVRNNSKDMTLFFMTQDVKDILLSGEQIDKGDFRNVKTLSKGNKLLIIQDENVWIKERLGYEPDEGYKRCDVLYLKDGRAINKTIMPYGNNYSRPSVTWCDVTRRKKEFKNLSFIRDASSSFRTDLLDVRRQYNVEISNVIITTPEDETSYNDGALFIACCSDVTLSDVDIHGTYSQKNLSGYGVRVVNVHDLKVTRMYARAKWGVFGNYSINKATLLNCDINRFDVHYYGKDIIMKGCKFSDLYNQFSSMCGYVIFVDCTFINCTPFLNESSFNAFTQYDISFKRCSFYLDKTHNHLIALCDLPDKLNERPELSKKYLPNIIVNNCRFVLGDDIIDWYIVNTGKIDFKGALDNNPSIMIKGFVNNNSEGILFSVFSDEIKMTKPCKIRQKLISE